MDALEPVQRPKRARNAVLVSMYRDENDQVRIILTKRPEHMRRHPGDVVFPGGRIENGEAPEETAIREAYEEIGLPGSAIDVVGGLSSVTTRDPLNLIVPVVARVRRPAALAPDEREVEAIIEPRMSDLLVDANWCSDRWFGKLVWSYEFDEGVMWGATASIMRELLAVLRGAPETAH